MKSMKLAAVLAFVAGSTVGLAAERTISQKGKIFSESVVELKKGETLVFLNDDNVPHNVLSTTPGDPNAALRIWFRDRAKGIRGAGPATST